MKIAWSMLTVLALVCCFTFAQADDKKEVTLKGTITCAKCALKIEKKCTTVIKVKEGEKDVVYYLDEESGKKNHKSICTEPKKGKVTGTVKKDGDKLIITATKVEFDD